jgi:hypothetical protein
MVVEVGLQLRPPRFGGRRFGLKGFTGSSAAVAAEQVPF